jgi:hypothetical protein
MQKIKLTIGALALAALADTRPSQAVDGPWCAYEQSKEGVPNRCDLMSYEACRAWIRGSPGTWCTQNPHYRAAEKSARRKTR